MKSKTSIVIVGAGPVGLLLAYQLSKFGVNDYIIVDKLAPGTQIYGRACSIWPRTIELWDQLGLMEDMFAAGGVISSTGYNFRDGKAIAGGLSFAHKMDRVGNTAFKFCFHLRQGMIEKVLRNKLKLEFEVEVYSGREVVGMDDLTVQGTTIASDYPVTLKVKDVGSDQIQAIQSKYVIGTDGGRSTMRKLSGIPFIGNKSGAKWIRMDAEVETDMPNPRCLNSIQSPTHGLILFCPVDDNLTRIGYVFSPALQKKWGVEGMNQVLGPIGTHGDGGPLNKDILIAEAKEAVKPFKLDFKRVDWYTIYGIGQCIAETFMKDRTILAGDACHTHSSGSAQGLNTGAQDAINLAWKLAYHLHGHCGETTTLLDSYAEERQAVAQKVIDNDAIIAALTSGDCPEKFAHRKDEDPRELLREWCESNENLQFTLGLGVSYPLNDVVSDQSDGIAVSTILPGERGPDGPLVKLGTAEPIRLHSVLPITGHFHVIVFAGTPHHPRASQGYAGFRNAMDSSDRFITLLPSSASTVKFITIAAAVATDTSQLLSGMLPFGRVYLDTSRNTHDAYGVDCETGGVVVLRPDGYIGTVIGLGENTNRALERYFRGFLRMSQAA